MSDQEAAPKRVRKVVETRHFTTEGRKEPSQADRDRIDREFLKDVALATPEGQEYFDEAFVNLRLPPHGDLPSVEMFNPMGIRMAAAFRRLGYVRVEDREEIRWIPSAGMAGKVSEMDQGVWIERNEDGTWPSMDPLDYIDPNDIKTEPTPDDEFEDEIDANRRYRAVHVPTGHVAYGRKPLNAHKNLIEKLERIEASREGDSEEV
ncbi:hypothetical protein PBI_CLUBL_136 [Gordonia phage ClubL]|uniref:Uncharacterized protein n=1 Tax=Gordonia phage ClubL TaxID=1838065 RepID=A0A160DHX1_9CAUD|nr:hypothetical protein BH768_gp071 [Gordonia phage ClubL]ANA86634.1 hypothetical protein PBI_CLUBL_136 [Gordonia phage ClubL]